MKTILLASCASTECASHNQIGSSINTISSDEKSSIDQSINILHVPQAKMKLSESYGNPNLSELKMEFC